MIWLIWVDPCLIYLTHFRLILYSRTHYLLEESYINFKYVRLCDLDIPREKWLNCLQTVETLIRCCILQHLIWVCTVCQLQTKMDLRLTYSKMFNCYVGKMFFAFIFTEDLTLACFTSQTINLTKDNPFVIKIT